MYRTVPKGGRMFNDHFVPAGMEIGKTYRGLPRGPSS